MCGCDWFLKTDQERIRVGADEKRKRGCRCVARIGKSRAIDPVLQVGGDLHCVGQFGRRSPAGETYPEIIGSGDAYNGRCRNTRADNAIRILQICVLEEINDPVEVWIGGIARDQIICRVGPEICLQPCLERGEFVGSQIETAKVRPGSVGLVAEIVARRRMVGANGDVQVCSCIDARGVGGQEEVLAGFVQECRACAGDV